MFRLSLFALLCLFLLPVQAQAPAWDGSSRFTVLVMGMDRRPSQGATLSIRTDAMLLMSIDPQTEQIGLLHIPRDLHLPPPGLDAFERVNTLLLLGENRQEGYGPYFVMDTLQYNLGIYIDRYVLFDFQAFITLVDAIGGLEISTDYVIDDPTYPNMYGGYDPFYLPAGDHLLDGADALKYARTRHGDNDYVRGVRQMEVIKAVHTQLGERDTLLNLIQQAPDLLDELDRNIYTDLSLDDMIELARYTAALPTDTIQTGSINEAYQMRYAFRGRNIHIPDRTQLADLMVEVFGEDYGQ